MSTQLRIAVVGGSLTGPATALFLQRAGFDAQLYEAVPSTVSLAGGVIGLEHPTLVALEQAGIGQDEIVPFTSERVVRVKVLDRSGTGRVQRIYPGRTTSWTLLNGALRSRLASGSYHAGKRVVDVQEHARGPATLMFADGDATAVDLVIFADGRRSTGRKLLDPGRQLRYAGYVAHRGNRANCPNDVRDAFMSFEPEASQFNTFPVIARDGAIKLDWTFYLNTSVHTFTEHFGDEPTNRTFVFPRYIRNEARWHVNQEARRLLPEREADVVLSTTDRMAAPVIDIDPPTRMVFPLGDAHAMLIGDALAPVRPHTGRGANNGIEQAADFVQTLRQHTRWGADRDAAFDSWQQRHMPVVRQALERGSRWGARLGLGMTS